ncbi:hypothetical protein ABZW18_00325 [Streptomyces sp. NPDC004647]|uniref:hypothetical protein n=1 Tax=Streptomyces sp. NPDC004647 TaxID=3154671 RepID=UPI00339F3733
MSATLPPLFSHRVPAEALSQLEPWLNPGPPRDNLHDSYNMACTLLAAATTALRQDRDEDTEEDLHGLVMQRAYSSGRAVGVMTETLGTYIGIPLFAGRVASEALRVRSQTDPSTACDETLRDLLDTGISRLWEAPDIPLEPGGESVLRGLAIMRHVKNLGYEREIPGLDVFGRTVACQPERYQPHLRTLNRAVFTQHVRGRHQAPRSPLAQALCGLL